MAQVKTGGWAAFWTQSGHRPAMYHITSYGVTDVGLERTNNEDAFFISAPDGLYVVCDGMGGHASGEIASAITVETMGQFVGTTIHESTFRWPFNSPTATTLETRILDCAVRLANRDVFNAASSETKHRGMGTTVVAMLAGEHQLGAVHVGDSRIYRLRDNKLEPVTEDHSLLNHYRRTRPMTKDEIKNFKGKNVIVRAVGLRESVQPEVHVVDYRVGDRYLLCTDGLTDLVDDEDIELEMISADAGLKEAVHRLVDRALALGGKDNITIAMLQIDAARADDETSEPSPEALADDTSPGFDAAEADGYWDQETMPAYEVGDLAKVLANTPPTADDPEELDSFSSDRTPIDTAIPDMGDGDDIPPPPAGVADISGADDAIPPPPTGRAMLPDTPPDGLVAASRLPGMTRPKAQAVAQTTPTRPGHVRRVGATTPGGSSHAGRPEQAKPAPGQPTDSQAADSAQWAETADLPVVGFNDPTDRQAAIQIGEQNPATDAAPVAPRPAVVVNVPNGAAAGDIGGEAQAPTGAPVQIARRMHAETARYQIANKGFTVDSPTPLAMPVVRPEDLIRPPPAEADEDTPKGDG